MSIPNAFKSYIDEDTYRDTSVALDILRSHKCPLYLQVEYVINHPSIQRKGNYKTLQLAAKDVDDFNRLVENENRIIYYDKHPFEIQQFQPKLIKVDKKPKSNKKVYSL